MEFEHQHERRLPDADSHSNGIAHGDTGYSNTDSHGISDTDSYTNRNAHSYSSTNAFADSDSFALGHVRPNDRYVREPGTHHHQ